MFRVINGRTADDAWQEVACAFRNGDGVSVQASRNGPTREILHAAISVSDPRQRWVVSRNPPINIAFALAEIVWIMAGRNDSVFLNYFNRGLPKYCGNGPIYHGAYGHRLRKQLKVDQLVRAYQVLKKNPESRQVVLQVWDGTVDLPKADGPRRNASLSLLLAFLGQQGEGSRRCFRMDPNHAQQRCLSRIAVQFRSVHDHARNRSWLAWAKPGNLQST